MWVWYDKQPTGMTMRSNPKHTMVVLPSPQAQTQERQQAEQAVPVLQPLLHHIQQIATMAIVLPFSNSVNYGPAFLQAALALLLTVVLVPLGLALQLQSTAGFTAADRAHSPWAGVLYIVAALPLLRLLMEPVASGLFYIGEVCSALKNCMITAACWASQ